MSLILHILCFYQLLPFHQSILIVFLLKLNFPELNSYSYLQCKDSLFFGLNSYSSIFSSDKPYSILLPSGLSGSISISAALCGSGEDNCIWKGSSSGVYVKTGYNLGCNPVDFPCSGSISGNWLPPISGFSYGFWYWISFYLSSTFEQRIGLFPFFFSSFSSWTIWKFRSNSIFIPEENMPNPIMLAILNLSLWNL